MAQGSSRAIQKLRRRLSEVLLGAALAGAAPAPAARAAARDPANPFAGQQQFMDCEQGHTSNAEPWSAWWHVYHARGSEAAAVAKIARVPTVKWFAGLASAHVLSRQLERYLANVDHPQWGGRNCATRLHYSGSTWRSGPVDASARDPYTGSFPVMAIRAMKHTTCRGWDGGPWNSVSPHGLYKSYIDAFVRQLTRTYDSSEAYAYWNAAPPPWASWRHVGRRAGVVILEPDALGLLGHLSGCLSGTGRRHVYSLLTYAVDRLSAVPGISVYIDAGAGDWLTHAEAVRMLRLSGIAHARGFAINATHFDATRNEMRFGDAVARSLHTHYVLNTAENGRGSLPKRKWGLLGPNAMTCNPRNAGLGRQPTSHTGSRYADAFLWISRPGLSSNGNNRCRRGPTSAVWFEAQAISLATKAVFQTPAWPPSKL